MVSTDTRLCGALVLAFLLANTGLAQEDFPKSTDPRLKVELYAENPQVVTPTGIDVDHDGRVWVIESNTHFPPEGYAGHPSDRILVMEGKDDAGRVKNITVFKDGLTHTMSIAVKPVWLDIEPRKPVEVFGKTDAQTPSTQKSMEVFVATRREIMLCVDTDGDFKCDKTIPLIRLETKGNYPHNGLAGFAFDAMGYMYFGFGENLGADYQIIGSDGTWYSGGGEGGFIYRCRPDGSHLQEWATGFWNPHANCVDAFGHLFSVDNDPDSRPPCRLLHIIESGDYGYRFRNGRKGTHPFTAWNGELPGTLPMVSGTGEAPSGIVCYESEGFPKDYVGTLLVGSWGDHRIDRFVLKPRGTSFESLPQPVIKGGENFRPVGLAVAPDGSIYFSDWVSKEYKLHGHGRIWRISSATPSHAKPADSVDALIKLASADAPWELSDNLIERRIQARKLAQMPTGRPALVKLLNDLRASERSRLEALWALANIPIDVENLKLITNGRAPAPFLQKLDNVSVAAAEIADSPQLRPQEKLPSGIVGKELLIPSNPWGEFVRAHLRGFFVSDSLTVPFEKFASVHDPFLETLNNRKLRQYLKPRANGPTLDIAELRRIAKQEAGLRHDGVWSYLLARKLEPKNLNVVRTGLKDPSIDVRRVAVQWAGENQLKDLRTDVEGVLGSEPMNGDLFMACLASLSLLDGVAPAEFEKAPPTQHILPLLKDPNRPPSLRAIALRVLPPTTKELDDKLMAELVVSPDPGLRTQAVRSLAQSRIADREQLLRRVAEDSSQDVQLRADAVAGLANPDHAKLNPETRDLLTNLAANDKSIDIQLEAIRSLRDRNSANSNEASHDPAVVEAWMQLRRRIFQIPTISKAPLAEALDFATNKYQVYTVAQTRDALYHDKGDDIDREPKRSLEEQINSGRRTFFHVNGAGCYKCHTVGGRGGQVGPDLTVIARTMDRVKLADSILEPSKEISPQFTTWSIETDSGKVLTGMLLGEEVNGDLRLGNNQGEVFRVPFKEIAARTPLNISVMPEKLHELMTQSEMKDLVTFLESLK